MIFRTLILAAIIGAVINLALDFPKPVKVSQVDSCVITYRGAGKDELGQWHFGWVQGYGPCYLLDRYENI